MRFRIPLIAVALSLLAGCATAPEMKPPQALPEPDLQRPEREHNGAIYQSGYDVRLYEDRRARRVGDIVTVILEEETDAAKDANTNIERESSYGLPTPTIAGRELSVNGNPFSFDLESETGFDGGGGSSQSNELSGTITATVIRVQHNGNLVIQGQKRLTLNRGDEYVTITGVVRPYDVGADNTVSSTRVANAQIAYTGTGALADSNRMGWLSRLFMSVIWPF